LGQRICLLGNAPLRLRGSGNAAAEAEARLKRLLGVGLRPLFGSKASVLGADLLDPPARSFRGYAALDLDQRFGIVFEAERAADFC
jgi:hypothetical protein